MSCAYHVNEHVMMSPESIASVYPLAYLYRRPAMYCACVCTRGVDYGLRSIVRCPLFPARRTTPLTNGRKTTIE